MTLLAWVALGLVAWLTLSLPLAVLVGRTLRHTRRTTTHPVHPERTPTP